MLLGTLLSVTQGPRWGGLLIVSLVGLGAAGWWLWDLYWASDRTNLSSFWQLVVAVAALGVALISLVKDWLATRKVGDDGGFALDRLTNRLADAVYQQWTQAAAERGLLHPDPIEVRWSKPPSVAGSAEAAIDSRRFAPIPGLAATRQEQLRQGGLQDLHTVYGGLGSGRLVIVGSPGSGKSGAAVLLVVAALDHQRAVEGTDRAKVPVPVLLTFAGWDPSTPLRDWLVSQLRQTYEGLFIGRRGVRTAARLLDEGKIAVILDGLDEIPEQLRPDALQALSEQAGFRLVILSRHDEMVGAAKKERLLGAVAVRLDDVDPDAAADYLERVQCDPPPDQWRELINRLRSAPASALTRALSNPLTLSLVRDTYRDGDSVRELLDFCDTTANTSREALETYLLDRVLPQAYRKRPGHPPPRYSLTTAQHTLQLIGSRMLQDSQDPQKPSRDLAWWRIPTWAPTLPRALIIGAASGLAVCLGFGLLYMSLWLTFFGNLVGLSSGLGGMLGAWLASKKTLQTAPARWRLMFRHSSLMFVAGVVFGFMLAFDVIRIIPADFLIGLCSGLVAGLAIWLVVGLVIRLAGKTRGRTALARWRSVHSPPVVFGFGLGFIGAAAMSDLSLSVQFLAGVLVGLFALGAGLRIGLGSLGQDSGSPPLPPLASWSQHRVTGLGIWFMLGGLTGGLLVRAGIRGWGVLSAPTLHAGLPIFLGIGLVSGLILGLIYPETWTTSLACAQLAIRQRTPLQLMRFLDDAHERGVLRASDSIYQFRHPRLQDRLADQANSVTSDGSD